MTGLFFEIDILAACIGAAFCLVALWLWSLNRKLTSPKLYFSALSEFKDAPRSWRVATARLPQALLWNALGIFLLAFIDPHVEVPRTTKPSILPSEGIAIYLVADQSGSMIEKGQGGISKIDLLKEITKQFVEGNSESKLAGRPNDLIGLVSFARTAHVLTPLTLDHAAVIKALSKLNVVTDKDQDGTATGYAIYKTANIIAATRHYAQDLIGSDQPAYDIKSAIMILITDGFPSPSPLDAGKRLRNIDPVEAAEYAKEKNIRLYIIVVEPALASSEFAPQRRLMQRTAQVTGGKFYMMDSSTSLNQIYADIDSLEKSMLPSGISPENIPKDKQPQLYHRISIYPWCLSIGMFLLLVSVMLQTTILKRGP